MKKFDVIAHDGSLLRTVKADFLSPKDGQYRLFRTSNSGLEIVAAFPQHSIMGVSLSENQAPSN